MKKRFASLVPFIGLVVVVAALGLLTRGALFAASNLNTILDQCFTIVILSVGCSFIYAHGGFDLSVGAVYGLCQALAGLFILQNGGTWIGLLICLLVSCVCGVIMGLVTVKLALPAFISSLCMQFFCRGITNTLISTNLALPDTLKRINTWGIKFAVLAIILIASVLLMDNSVFGRHNAAIGENPQAARQSGINLSRVRMKAYLYSALLVGVAAFFAMCRTRSVVSLAGNGYEMDVIIAIVLGGMTLNGGMHSSVRAPVIGGVILTVLTNGLVMLGVNYVYLDLISGVIFLAVVLTTHKRSRSGLLPR